MLPYLEQSANNPADPQTVALFLCPSRRGANVGPRDDYGAAQHPDWWYWIWPGYYSILGGPATHSGPHSYGGTTLTHVTGSDGASNTLLLAHKGVAPEYYSGGSPDLDGPSDKSWSSGGSWEHRRAPWLFLPDSNRHEMEEYLGGPHPSAMPVLFADGSVRALRYNVSTDVLPRLWAWNDGCSVRNESLE